MRRVYTVLVCYALFALTIPARAYAWWDVVEQFSGAGPWKGFDIEARLVCFVDTSGDRQPRIDALKNTTDARKLSKGQQLGSGNQTGTEVERWRAATTGWKQAVDSWVAVAGASAYKAIEAKLEADRRLERATNDANVATLKDAASALELAALAMEDVADAGRVRAFAAPGLLYSACSLKPGERRRGSIDFGMRFVWAEDDVRFANKQRIGLTTAETIFAWSIVNNPRWDVIDYGLGGGIYWIASTEFPSFRGGFLEPVRLDFHPPTRSRGWKALIFRVGVLVFPGGFEPTAFAPAPGVGQRIPRDWVPTYAILADLEPLIRGMNK